MNTPNTKAGQLTEKIMLNIKKKIHPTELTTQFYNRIYEAVLTTLEKEQCDPVKKAVSEYYDRISIK